jgi:hypothetical protein
VRQRTLLALKSASISVVEAEGGCFVDWRASFEVAEGPADEACGMMKGVYEEGMSALREAHAGWVHRSTYAGGAVGTG